MTNKGSRARSAHKPKLRLLDLTFDEKTVKEHLRNGKRPHGGLRGSKAHPISPYSFNKNGEYQRQMKEDVNKMFYDEFLDGRASPAWAFDVSKEITHSGESPFFVHGLLSSSRVNSEGSLIQAQKRSTTPVSGLHHPPHKRATSYYRSNTPHQYLTATDPQTLTESQLKYGRPTRTTLLRARQRCASAPVNSYDVRREMIKNIVLDLLLYILTFSFSNSQMVLVLLLSCFNTLICMNGVDLNVFDDLFSVLIFRVLPAAMDGESAHAFLTGARYNRAHCLDAKSLSVYGVYMPRTNPHGIFMTGHASQRSRERGQNVPSVPPDSPRSDVDDSSQPERRPSTAPGKRLLSSSVNSRPRTAWGEHSTSVTVLHNDNQSENVKRIKSRRKKKVTVTFKSSKPKGFESVLPSVTGKTAPKMYYRKPRDLGEDSFHQPPPTPASVFSIKDGSERGPEDGEKNLERIKEVLSESSSRGEKHEKVAADLTSSEKKDLHLDIGKSDDNTQSPNIEKSVEMEVSDESGMGMKQTEEKPVDSIEVDKIPSESEGKTEPENVATDRSSNQKTELDVQHVKTVPSDSKPEKFTGKITGESLFKANSATPRLNTPREKTQSSDGDSKLQTNVQGSSPRKDVSGPEFFITKENSEKENEKPNQENNLVEGVTSIQVTIVDKSGEKVS
ncbi:hypothetical protein FSP39_015545 [Pinctada imbricata]|uniref:Uncharacterized protein n=1 Tax=Pinctada imbricata TaxID=66713 RepID=A0AA88Y0Q1_PINIB|nr:hypothetical protein FSP39_015545 [Pinctada imbricata]